ncbi:unnamed protein product, partial [Prorocentrum cordatum]
WRQKDRPRLQGPEDDAGADYQVSAAARSDERGGDRLRPSPDRHKQPRSDKDERVGHEVLGRGRSPGPRPLPRTTSPLGLRRPTDGLDGAHGGSGGTEANRAEDREDGGHRQCRQDPNLQNGQILRPESDAVPRPRDPDHPRRPGPDRREAEAGPCATHPQGGGTPREDRGVHGRVCADGDRGATL